MIRRVLQVTETRGRGVDGDPVRHVKVFHDEEDLSYICEWDAWKEETLRKDLNAEYQAKMNRTPNDWLDGLFRNLWALREMCLDEITSETNYEFNRIIDVVQKECDRVGIKRSDGLVLNLRRNAPPEGGRH